MDEYTFKSISDALQARWWRCMRSCFAHEESWRKKWVAKNLHFCNLFHPRAATCLWSRSSRCLFYAPCVLPRYLLVRYRHTLLQTWKNLDAQQWSCSKQQVTWFLACVSFFLSLSRDLYVGGVNQYGTDISPLAVTATYQSCMSEVFFLCILEWSKVTLHFFPLKKASTIEVKIYDPSNARWEVPEEFIPRPTSCYTGTSDIVFSYTQTPFSFAIARCMMHWNDATCSLNHSLRFHTSNWRGFIQQFNNSRHSYQWPHLWRSGIIISSDNFLFFPLSLSLSPCIESHSF